MAERSFESSVSVTTHPPTVLDRLFYTHVHPHTQTHTNPDLLMSQQAFRGTREETLRQTPVSINLQGGFLLLRGQVLHVTTFHSVLKAYSPPILSLSLNLLFTLEFIPLSLCNAKLKFTLQSYLLFLASWLICPF